ncbi:MAG TPA: hypothetical protein VEI54_00215 [Candidatus Limnocylindrales bacterium]|nr:hypothetical protein [Candidatus Limnocylindrales bacterium]
MRKLLSVSGFGALGLMVLGTVTAHRVAAQDPVLTPVIVSQAAPIVTKVIQPKQKSTGTQKFQGYFLHANVAQVTVRSKDNEMAIQTFPLSEAMAAKMQKIIDKGGYQYGDKITVYYDPQTHTALKLKGKPSRPL